ncbi:hypothetical protein [Streptomyces triticirhizae]|uniref:Pyridoxamine 5'-phosphate oxidase family protein n=1 Tax=Streptomyces triticirhizae TaxID=2483353 RepID=A0A3M2L199_9ACTN|nr:hypothetical protein [Streptomyces triticirhizae]RMI31154.1 hypothetical protein EBN88_25975 [Streptomyces triticirhizae]
MATATAVGRDGFDRALVEEAARKSALVWVRGPEGPARALWHVWHEGAVWLVGGPGEQPLDGLGLTPGARATVSCRSKDKGGRLVVWAAEVAEPDREDPDWGPAVAELAGKRLNAPDTARLTERWAAECRVLRLSPVGEPLQRPGAMPDGDGAAAPLPTPASTRVATPSGLPTRRRRSRPGRRG